MDLRLNYSMKIFVGYDTREDIANSKFVSTQFTNTAILVEVIPLNQNILRQDKWYWRGEDKLVPTEFITRRPAALANYEGWALFCDSDIVFLRDVKELFDPSR